VQKESHANDVPKAHLLNSFVELNQRALTPQLAAGLASECDRFGKFPTVEDSLQRLHLRTSSEPQSNSSSTGLAAGSINYKTGTVRTLSILNYEWGAWRSINNTPAPHTIEMTSTETESRQVNSLSMNSLPGGF
jgi:hypothetical protein